MTEYFIRLTPTSSCSLDDAETLLREINVDIYVVSYEEASRPHFHAYIKSSYSPERLRYRLKSHFTGQVYISGKEVIDKVKAIAYTIKDGKYRYSNIDVNTLLMAESISKPKFNFDQELKTIADSDASIEKIVDDIIDLYIKGNRKIYFQHIQGIVRTIQAKRCSSYRYELRNKILDNL